jgi:hypothetical protein
MPVWLLAFYPDKTRFAKGERPWKRLLLNFDILRFPGDVLFMLRKVRHEYPGAIYHVMSRGDQRQDIFLDARLEAAEAKAQRMVAEDLARLHWTQNDLATQQKSHPSKLYENTNNTDSLVPHLVLGLWLDMWLGHRFDRHRTLARRGIARRHLARPHSTTHRPNSDPSSCWQE